MAMFLLRSAFWLTLVFSAIPFESNETGGAIGLAPPRLAAADSSVTRPECLERSAGCDPIGALLLATSRSDELAPAPSIRASNNAPREEARHKALRPSADSLTEGDRAAPWHGRKTKSGA